jgi:SAM-dependent methyltransferase
MDDFALLIDLHVAAARQGPGGDALTRRAVDLSGLAGRRRLRVADIGCGTGAATLVLAETLDADVVAVDFVPDFLAALQARAALRGLGGRITAVQASMDALPFEPESFDAIWSEGAVYNMGFERGVHAWRRFLRPGGILAVSELSWLRTPRPAELEAHWVAQYPEVDTVAAKWAVLERRGYSPLGCFVLPPEAWLEAYYRPMQRRFESFLARHGGNAAARALVAAEQAEIALYERYASFVGYGYYVARKVDSEG